MLKAYKSLEGYKYFTAGWVSNATLQKLPGSVPVKVILTAKVKHSQALSATPLQPWVAVDQFTLIMHHTIYIYLIIFLMHI